MTYRKLLAAACATVVITTVALGLVASVSAADKYEVIYSVSGVSGGAGPTGRLIFDAAGNLYGTASYEGGSASSGGNGVVFKLSHDTSGRWSETVLHSFQGKDGANPAAGLIFDKAGNLYGTTTLGGTYGNGVVFKLTHEPNGRWSETVLHSFQGKDGANPWGDLVLDRAGNLYGTAQSGGGHNSGLVFKLSPATNGEWIETVLLNFQGTDGANPFGGLILDRAGNLYGTTYNGGARNNGTVFKLTPESDGEWSETVLHSFQGKDGANPYAGLIFDRAGNLYGTTYDGGARNNGTVFKLTPEPGGEWNETVLHSFQGKDGANPYAGLIFDRAGNLYGTTLSGGVLTFFGGYGVVFKLSPDPDGEWSETVLHSFHGRPDDGYQPSGVLIIDTAGHLYGTTGHGGSSDNCFYAGCGTVFQITP